MKKTFYIIFALLFSLTPLLSFSKTVDRIVAVVNNSIITESSLDAAVASYLGGLKEGDTPKEAGVDTRSKVLDIMVERELMKQSADKDGIDVSEDEIDSLINDIKSRSGISEEKLLVELAKNGLTMALYRDQLREEIRQSKFMNNKFRSGINITNSDLKIFYTQNNSDFQNPPLYGIALIVVQDKKTADIVSNKLSQGEDFTALAKEFSKGPAASSGGDLGLFPLEELDSAIAEVVRSMNKGAVKGPIRINKDFRFVKLTAVKEGSAIPLEEVEGTVRDLLQKKIIEEKYKAWLDEMRTNAYIEIRL